MGKRKRRVENESELPSTFLYASRGRRIFSGALALLVCLAEKTIERHTNKVESNKEYTLNHFNHSSAYSRKLAVQSIVLYFYLNVFVSDHVRECPSRRGSKGDEPFQLIQSTWAKVDVHDNYVKQWARLMDAAPLLEPTIVRLSGTI